MVELHSNMVVKLEYKSKLGSLDSRLTMKQSSEICAPHKKQQMHTVKLEVTNHWHSSWFYSSKGSSSLSPYHLTSSILSAPPA